MNFPTPRAFRKATFGSIPAHLNKKKPPHKGGFFCLVDLACKNSNTIFEVLEKWESYLKAENIDIPKLLKEAEESANSV